ncbi:MAG: NTP transferase domain-containing protein [Sandaracinobacter sp.]
MRVGALLLAAGLSRRMGAAKLALPVDGVPMLARTISAVRQARLPILLVTGAHAQAVLSAAGDLAAVHADRHAEGLAESLKTGLRAAPSTWDAALVVLGDMPFVAAETLTALAAALATGAPAVVPVHAGRRGNPAGFARNTWPALLTLSGDQGARPILDSLGVVDVAVDDPGIHRDIDVPADLKG